MLSHAKGLFCCVCPVDMMKKFIIVDLATGVASMHGLDGFDARGTL